MRIIIFVAMKEHSQRCPGKNIVVMESQMELLRQINDCPSFELIICTDSKFLQQKAETAGFEWIDRPTYTTWQGGGSFKVQLYAVDVLGLADEDIFIDLNLCHMGITLDMIVDIAAACEFKRTTILSLEPSKIPPQKQFFIRGKRPVPVMGIEISQYQMTSQLLEQAYIPSGVHAIPVRHMKQYGSVYNPEAEIFTISPTIDIDTPEDLMGLGRK